MGLVYLFAATAVCAISVGVYFLVKYPDVYFKKKRPA